MPALPIAVRPALLPLSINIVYTPSHMIFFKIGKTQTTVF